MLKLIRLEIKKCKLGGYVKGAWIVNLAIIGFLFLVNFAEKAEGKAAFINYETAFNISGSLIRAAFIIFASELLSRLIID